MFKCIVHVTTLPHTPLLYSQTTYVTQQQGNLTQTIFWTIGQDVSTTAQAAVGQVQSEDQLPTFTLLDLSTRSSRAHKTKLETQNKG